MRTLLVLAVLAALISPTTAHAWIPDDKGIGGLGWQADQWNFLPGTGVDAPRAWDNLFAAGRPGGKGVKIAVLDSGAAYRSNGRFKQSPELKSIRFAKGYDFCARTSDGFNACEGRDAYPNDDYGHGTHVISTIAETTGNGVGLTGLAYGATIIPVKVLNARGEGDEATIAAGIRYAVKQGAQVINLSFEFGEGTTSANQIRSIAAAVRYARSKNVTLVAASGNTKSSRVGFPAALPGVISVGAVTERGCAAVYSNTGDGLDLVAPGGGRDMAVPGQANCLPNGPDGRPIFQLTFARERKVTSFGYPGDYFGTSMATPHVSATAALIIASGVLGSKPTPDQIEAHLKATARDLGVPGVDSIYGAGMVDAGAATARP
ncbi:S8 family serine peptidase [Solirubrobacter sp. CPCC 204708]|uniref:S8 family serine peptidase n=1 Tax=Solirubrobacter deserti TaxID=2282478 RepID=A0ABT4RH94_9ACTN|nr:S8 family serine peptidase [Solirubrobacter deserti]MBE2315223.1 S8 family serine peptidase [Solirubrobacter deserti]MDA0137907.1 S8 family serine peptidase [Solirubrobacter deserti]